MQEKKGRTGRRNEVLTGLILILVAISFVTSLLLDFKFVSPYATLQEDLSYLSENDISQKISSIAWLVTALITALSIPFYFSIFRKKTQSTALPECTLHDGSISRIPDDGAGGTGASQGYFRPGA